MAPVYYAFVLAAAFFLPLPPASTEPGRMVDGRAGVGREIVIDWCPENPLPFCF